MTAPSIVRIAKPDDQQEVWRLLLQSHRENGQFTLAPDKVDWYVQRALRPELIPDWDMGTRPVIAVIGKTGSLEAIALMTVEAYWYTHEKHIGEYVVYVDPECRRSEHATALLRWMQLQSDKTGLPLFAGIISNERTEAKVRLYRRKMRMAPAGVFFIHRSIKLSSDAA